MKVNGNLSETPTSWPPLTTSLEEALARAAPVSYRPSGDMCGEMSDWIRPRLCSQSGAGRETALLQGIKKAPG